jgi:hypothetical protein
VRNPTLSGARSEFRSPRTIAVIAKRRAAWAAEKRAEGRADAAAERPGRYPRQPLTADYWAGYDEMSQQLADDYADACYDAARL